MFASGLSRVQCQSLLGCITQVSYSCPRCAKIGLASRLALPLWTSESGRSGECFTLQFSGEGRVHELDQRTSDQER